MTAPRDLCGAKPRPPIRETANCVRPSGHSLRHRNMEGDEWADAAMLRDELLRRWRDGMGSLLGSSFLDELIEVVQYETRREVERERRG